MSAGAIDRAESSLADIDAGRDIDLGTVHDLPYKRTISFVIRFKDDQEETPVQAQCLLLPQCGTRSSVTMSSMDDPGARRNNGHPSKRENARPNGAQTEETVQC